MTIPLWLADGIARLVQQLPSRVRIPPEIAFTEFPARTGRTVIPTRHGEVAATLYRPDGDPRGVYVNLHGGGFVMRVPEQDDPLCRYLAEHAGVIVVNVDYDTAPLLRFPGQVEQVRDVVVWAVSPGRPWDTSRVAVGGQSAGGALAAGAARLALEQSAPIISLQVLMYPPLDMSLPASAKRTPGKERFLTAMAPVFDTVYCPDPRQRGDRLISPAGPEDTAPVHGIAPAVVVTAQRDILREEGVRYARRLAAAGSLLEHVDLPDVGHGFNILGAPRETVTHVYDRIAHHVIATMT